MEKRAAYETYEFYSVITGIDGRDGPVGTVSRYGLNGPGFEIQWGGGEGRDSPDSSRPARRPGVKPADRGADNPSPS